MKYIVRALKYFVYITILMVLLLAVLVALGMVSSDVDVMFRNGWKSVWMILGMFFLVALVYPRVGYTRRAAHIPGSYAEIRDGVVRYMEDHGYRLEKEEGENLTFVSRSLLKRILRIWEDRISLEREFAGFSVEGLTRDVTQIVYGLEFKFRNPDGEA
ncbi:MAG: hypothetical protein IKR32_01870 [Bacteroidales bacterium]|jgi:hypothetical protein|nr:hypothetical protein [Bacteroidales bacterium]